MGANSLGSSQLKLELLFSLILLFSPQIVFSSLTNKNYTTDCVVTIDKPGLNSKKTCYNYCFFLPWSLSRKAKPWSWASCFIRGHLTLGDVRLGETMGRPLFLLLSPIHITLSSSTRKDCTPSKCGMIVPFVYIVLILFLALKSNKITSRKCSVYYFYNLCYGCFNIVVSP